MSTDWLRDRAHDCEKAAGQLQGFGKKGQQACDEIEQAFSGWNLKAGIEQLRNRWQALDDLLQTRLTNASQAFDSCAEAYEVNEQAVSAHFARIHRG